RVLRTDGGLILGLVLAEGAWGRHYYRLGAQRHPYYQQAHFFTRPELTGLLTQAGFRAVRTRSALLEPPDVEHVEPPAVDAREGDEPAAG
ncbi:MAG: hypothetical protein C4289_04545, partial [Chloroflexota bacterium]